MFDTSRRIEFYGYKHWTTEEIPRCFNIGKGLNGRAQSKKNRNHKWHAIVKRYGLRVEVCVGPVSHFDACAWEIEQIAQMGTFSINHLHDDSNDIGCNLTKGGEGTFGRPVSEDTRKRISATQSGEKSVWFGRKHTDEVKNTIGAKNRGKIRASITRAMIGSKLVGRSRAERSIEHCRKISEANKRRKGRKLHCVARIRRFNMSLSNTNHQLVVLCGGPDMCGKTNILRELERRLHVPYFKSSQEHENFLSAQDRFINELRYADPRMVDFLYQTGVSVLVDRAYMCEWVYSQFFHRETDMSMLRKMDNAYSRIGAKILICTRKSFADIKDDLDPRLDEHALSKISKLYEDFSRWTKCKTYTLFVDDEDLEREVNEVLRFLTETT